MPLRPKGVRISRGGGIFDREDKFVHMVHLIGGKPNVLNEEVFAHIIQTPPRHAGKKTSCHSRSLPLTEAPSKA